MKTSYKLSFLDPSKYDEDNFNKVWAIKQIRMLGNSGAVGLKYAKDLIELLMANPLDTVVLEGEVVGEKQMRDSLEQLKTMGIKAVSTAEVPLNLVKEAASIGLEVGAYALTRDLLEVLIRHGKYDQ